jgi:hypothetical protein
MPRRLGKDVRQLASATDPIVKLSRSLRDIPRALSVECRAFAPSKGCSSLFTGTIVAMGIA